MARLAPGASLRGAQAEIDVFSGRLAQQYPGAMRADHSGDFVGDVCGECGSEAAVDAVWCGASVLFIGCLNIAGLLLARGLDADGRQRFAYRWVRVRTIGEAVLCGEPIACPHGLRWRPAARVCGRGGFQRALPAYVPNLATITVTWPVVVLGSGFAVGGVAFRRFAGVAICKRCAGFRVEGRRGGDRGVRKNRLRVVGCSGGCGFGGLVDDFGIIGQ